MAKHIVTFLLFWGPVLTGGSVLTGVNCGKKADGTKERSRMASGPRAPNSRQGTSGLPPRPAAPQPPKVTQDSVTFKRRPFEVGSVHTMTATETMALEVPRGNRYLSWKRTSDRKMRLTVLAMQGLAPTRIRVTYLKDETLEEHKGEERIADSLLLGKTFFLERRGGRLLLRDSKNRQVYGPLGRILLREHQFLGDTDPLLATLPTGRITPGSELPRLAQGLKYSWERESVTQDPTYRIAYKHPRVVYLGTGELGGKPVGVFRTSMTLETSMGPAYEMTFSLRGWFAVRLDTGWTVKNVASGPVAIGTLRNAGWTIVVTTHEQIK